MEFIYRLTDGDRAVWLAPLCFEAIVELTDPAIGCDNRDARVRACMFCDQCDCPFPDLGKVINHALDGKSLTIGNGTALVLDLNYYVFGIVILDNRIDIRGIDTAIQSKSLEIDKLACVVRVSDSAFFRTRHELLDLLDGLQDFGQFRSGGSRTTGVLTLRTP